MKIDKGALKKCIDQAKPREILVLHINKTGTDSLKLAQSQINQFVNHQHNYIITIIEQ